MLTSDTNIHPTAIIDPKAQIGTGVSVGPYTIIGSEVLIGDGNIIENHVTIKGKTTIGHQNTIGPYVSIGLSAQDKAHRNEPTRVEIGDSNEIREYVSIQRGTLGSTGITKIGSHNQIMVYAHFAHDTSLGDHCMLANATTLGGHAQIGSYVVTGGLSAMHQFCRIGDFAMIGGLSAINQDVPPYMLCTGHRAKVYGINRVGLERNSFSPEEIFLIQKIFDIYFCKGLVSKKAIEMLQKEITNSRVLDPFIDFIRQSTRGVLSKV